jgi:hypothetical protein
VDDIEFKAVSESGIFPNANFFLRPWRFKGSEFRPARRGTAQRPNRLNG